MKKAILLPVLSVIAVAMITGCAYNQPTLLPSGSRPQTFEAEKYRPKVHNFMVIFDASHSMSYWNRGSSRMKTAKTIVSNMNRSLPEMPINGGLRSFGHRPSVSDENTVLMYGLTAHTTSGFQNGLDKLTCPGGFSLLAAALDAAGEDLGSAVGKIALIIVSDGEGMGDETLASAKKLKDRFGDRLCIYTIHIGDDVAGGRILGKIAQVGGCGYAKSDTELTSGSEIFAFVKDVFLEKRVDADQDGVYDDEDDCPDTMTGVKVDSNGCPFDTDGDGVYDDADACPNTPAGVRVDSEGCPLDADGDGVYDDQDACPNTPAGVRVNSEGCPLDADGDGVYDDQDACPDTPAGVSVDRAGCPLDTDGDGVADYQDQCLNTPEYTQVDTVGCPLDTDQDGVADYMDKCPYTRKDAKVDTQGCPMDSDGDGVVDYLDNCPDTAKGTEVDYSGCPMIKATKSAKVTDAGTWLYEDIKFDSGSAKIKSASNPMLDEIAALLISKPGLKVEIQGHTDSAGGREMNMQLSQARAESVAAYLLQKGVSSDQLTTEGYGPSRPMVSNDSATGRSKNRRVELKPLK